MKNTSSTSYALTVDKGIYATYVTSMPHFTLYMHYMLLLFFSVLFFCMSLATAQAQTKALKLYFIHTGEKSEIVFKRDGKFDIDGLKKLNYFLRDWRRNEPTNMDPRLFDLLWTVYELSGSKDYINVISAYRSPATNSMLRSKSKNSGVAKSSQHMLGHAMDFYLPDVNLSKLRAIGLQQEVGGVGYYPTSGSPFVHLDVGSVRYWPRMSRKELMALFPDGKTMYIPSDGRALPGYNQAKANYQARNGAPIMMADLENSSDKKGGFFSNLFGKRNKDNEEETNIATAPENQNPQIVASAPAISSLDLPESDAPLPIPSPLYLKDEDEEEEDNIIQSLLAQNDTTLNNTELNDEAASQTIEPENTPANSNENAIAYAHIPIPIQKPQNLALAAQNIGSLPIPTPQKQQDNNIDSANLVAAADNDARSAIIAKTLQEKALEVDASDNNLAALIASNRYITIPDDDEYNDEEEDYADIEDQEANSQRIAALEKSDNRQNQNAIPLSAEPELLKIPDIIYVSGLIQPNEIYNDQELHGRAVEFHPIVRIN